LKLKTAKLKYGCNMAGQFVPKGTELEVLDATSDRVQAVWPGIESKMHSKAVAVQFRHISFPTLVHIDELDFTN
jgi:hypothetical protein